MNANKCFSIAMTLFAFSVHFATSAHSHEHHHGDHANLDQERPAAISGASVYQIDSKWTDQYGAKVSLNHFSGKPLVLSMAYTSCKSACPILVSDMKRIEQALPANLKGKVQFALFSFDPKNDTPDALKAYAKLHGLDLSVWTLLTSNGAQAKSGAVHLLPGVD